MVGSRRALAGSAVALVLVAACGGGSPSTAPTQAPTVTAAPTQPASATAAPTQAAATTDPYAFVSQFEGTYSGSWTNTTYGSTGPASIELHLDRAAGTLGFTISLGGNIFGGAAPAPETLSATITPGQPMSFTSKTFGATTVSVDMTGASPTVTVSSPDVPSARIKSFTATASIIDANSIDFDYVVGFRDGTPDAQGNAPLKKG